MIIMMMLQIQMGKDGVSEKTINDAGSLGLCSGSQCAMWEPEYELESKQTVRGEDIPKGWHIVSNDIDYKQTIGRYIKIASGDCSLKTKESGCFYPG